MLLRSVLVNHGTLLSNGVPHYQRGHVMPETWTFHSAGKLVFGPDAAAQIGELAARRRIDRALLVTDAVFLKTGLADQVARSLRQHVPAVEVFGDGEPEPSFEAIEHCVTVARQFRPAGVVGLGGGSNMDLAKVVSTILAHGGKPIDYVGEDRVPGPILPLICVPTTAGTGSEVSAAAVLTDRANQVKVGILSNYLRPQIALVDPLLTMTCPPKLTADSGIDALTHAIEAFTAVDNEAFPVPTGERSIYQGRHPLGDCLAEKAIQLIGANLRLAVRESNNMAAREAMSLGATLAGLAFSNVGVALVHALEYPVGGATHCSHGCGNGLLLPYVMRFNLHARTGRFAAIARLLGANVAGMAEEAAAHRAIAEVERLRVDIGIPTRLRELGVAREQLRAFAEKAASIKRLLRVNPRQASPEDLLAILEAAY
jgi:alcohol dehydrogenase class IV